MKKYTKGLLIIAAIIFVVASFVNTGCGQSKDNNTAQDNVVYTCPMHPTYTSDKPGICPICGMNLVKKESGSSNITTPSGMNTPAQTDEKTAEEVCVTHKCTMKNCPMMIKANLKPGERIKCPVCGEYIVATSGKLVEVANDKTSQATVPVEAKKERKLLYYRNPMNPETTSPVPMKDSMGMDYVPVYDLPAGRQEKTPTTSTYGGPTVMISPERQQMIGVASEPVQLRELNKVVRASGKIAYDPQLAVAQEEFIQALSSQENLKDSPLADVIDRAKSLTDAARNKLKLLGMSDDQIVALEQSKKAETNLYLPGNGENVWAYINVYEYEIGFIKVGDSVELEAVAYPGENFTGKVVSLSPVLDATTRTNQVRVEVPNPDNKLKPEMFVNALIQESLGQKLAVPETAVLDTGLRKIVYLSEPNDILESREVTLGQKAENYYEVLSGLKEGDIVVTSGNFLVDSESKLKSPSQGN